MNIHPCVSACLNVKMAVSLAVYSVFCHFLGVGSILFLSFSSSLFFSGQDLSHIWGGFSTASFVIFAAECGERHLQLGPMLGSYDVSCHFSFTGSKVHSTMSCTCS